LNREHLGGNDFISGGDGNDSINGADGNDVIFRGSGQNQLVGGAGDDVMFGGDGDDNLQGGIGNDTLSDGQGQDTLLGQDGNDLLDGNEGDDNLQGGNGNDTLVGGPNNDTCNGGAGINTLAQCEFGAPNSCVDGIQDGTESDIDCGGACPKCPDGDACITGNDCLGQICSGSVCQTGSGGGTGLVQASLQVTVRLGRWLLLRALRHQQQPRPRQQLEHERKHSSGDDLHHLERQLLR
jgi:Ca2+-binding RTX toxin-like protein